MCYSVGNFPWNFSKLTDVHRLDKVTSDIIISLNIPLQGPLSDEYPGSYTFQTLLQTLKVNNWALFG